MKQPTFGFLGLAVLALAGASHAAEFHVAPSGDPGNPGTDVDPWDLATALAHPAAVQPGDTIWLHDGTYEGSFTTSLDGEDGAPIIVRSYPGEWAVVDGASSEDETVAFGGSWTHYRDFEITNSEEDRWDGRPGMRVTGPDLKLINLVIHDTGGNGFWTSATDLEVYGCLIYHCGYDDEDRGHGHAVYIQNETGTKHVEDNILFGGYSFGVHAYTEGGAIDHMALVGNIWFNAGVISSVSGHKDDCLIGGLQPADDILLHENLGWSSSLGSRNVRLGYSADNGACTVTDNYLSGELQFGAAWDSITMTGNTLGSLDGADAGAYPANTYLEQTPVDPVVFVRPNRYEDGRAHVAVFNGPELDEVEVDLGGVLEPGQGFEVRNAQDFLGAPVVTGAYQGAPVALPMDLTPVQPVGSPGAYEPGDQTGRAFNAFVVLRNAAHDEPVGDDDAGDDDGGDDDAGDDDGGDDDAGDDDGGDDDDAGATGDCQCSVDGVASVPWWLLVTLTAILALRAVRR